MEFVANESQLQSEDGDWSVVTNKKQTSSSNKKDTKDHQKGKFDKNKRGSTGKNAPKDQKAGKEGIKHKHDDNKHSSQSNKDHGKQVPTKNEKGNVTSKTNKIEVTEKVVEEVAQEVSALNVNDEVSTNQAKELESTTNESKEESPVPTTTTTPVKPSFKNMAEALKSGLKVTESSETQESTNPDAAFTPSLSHIEGGKISVLEFCVLSQQFNFMKNHMIEEKVYKMTR